MGLLHFTLITQWAMTALLPSAMPGNDEMRAMDAYLTYLLLNTRHPLEKYLLLLIQRQLLKAWQAAGPD